MWYKRGLLVFLVMLLSVTLVGCDIPFLNDKGGGSQQQQEKTKNTKGKSAKALKHDPNEIDVQQEKRPKVTVNLPPKMTTQHEKLRVSGKADLNSTVYINGAAVRVRDDGTFTGNINLKPGANTVEVVAVDKNENSTLLKREVYLGFKKPMLQVFAPVDSTTANVIISGHTDPDCMVYINNNKVKADSKGSFTGTVELKNRGNNVISVTSVNAQGISSSTSRTIKGIAPRVQVAAPDLTTEDRATISGVTDTHTSIVVLIGSEKAKVNNKDGVFETTVELEPGINDVTVIATNLFGSTEIPLTILYDDYNNN